MTTPQGDRVLHLAACICVRHGPSPGRPKEGCFLESIELIDVGALRQRQAHAGCIAHSVNELDPAHLADGKVLPWIVPSSVTHLVKHNARRQCERNTWRGGYQSTQQARRPLRLPCSLAPHC